jgi:hypothetical protein
MVLLYDMIVKNLAIAWDRMGLPKPRATSVGNGFGKEVVRKSLAHHLQEIYRMQRR